MMSTHVPWLLKVANLSSQSLAATVTLDGEKRVAVTIQVALSIIESLVNHSAYSVAH